MNGMQDGPEDSGESWTSSLAELEEVFGVVGARFDAEWIALGGPGVVPLRGADLPSLYVSHEEAKRLSELLRMALGAHDLTGAEFPELCGKVDAQGRPMVVIGGVSATTVLRLVAVLNRSGPAPEAIRPAA